jgi:hypothetical protein
MFPSLDLYFLLSHQTFSILLSLRLRACCHALVPMDLFIFTSTYAIHHHVGLSLAKAVLHSFIHSFPFLLTRLVAYLFSCVGPSSYKYHHLALLNRRQLWPISPSHLVSCACEATVAHFSLLSVSSAFVCFTTCPNKPLPTCPDLIQTYA